MITPDDYQKMFAPAPPREEAMQLIREHIDRAIRAAGSTRPQRNSILILHPTPAQDWTQDETATVLAEYARSGWIVSDRHTDVVCKLSLPTYR